MKKNLICLILLFFYVSLISNAEEPKYEKQSDKKNEFQKVHEYIYTEMILEDFETTTYSDDNLKSMQRDTQGVLTISDQYPAPINNSKKYLGIKVYAKKGNTFRIEPAQPIEITKYCTTISMWVYGEKIAGEISIMLQDSLRNNHLLNFGSAASPGWKKISQNLGTKIKQHVDYLGSENPIKILYIQYRAAGRVHPEWQFFYIDDITATVRDKYMDRQADDW